MLPVTGYTLFTSYAHFASLCGVSEPVRYIARFRARLLQVTSRARSLLHGCEAQIRSLQRENSMTSALCTVLEQSSLSNCESDNTSISVDSDMHRPRQKKSFESSHPGEAMRDTTSCPLFRSESDQSIEIMDSRRVPSLDLPDLPDKTT